MQLRIEKKKKKKKKEYKKIIEIPVIYPITNLIHQSLISIRLETVAGKKKKNRSKNNLCDMLKCTRLLIGSYQ